MLEEISSPANLQGRSQAELVELAQEIREFLVEKVSRTGGHLGPNLGVVELTIAMHRVFQSPHDVLLFDTGHQSYVHKILTGRADGFENLRQRGGLAGYPNRRESEHDVIENSHASTALSWADGIARAFKVQGIKDRTVVALVGDGALTGGMSWEALNNIASAQNLRLVIVVNDNERSYSPTIGGLATYLSTLRTTSGYERFLDWGKGVLEKTPVVGTPIYETLHGVKKGIKDIVAPQGMFEDLGLKYVGPVDGHNIEALETALNHAKNFGEPVIVHAITEKGRGHAPAINDEAEKFHAVGIVDPETGVPLAKSSATWTSIFSDELLKLGASRPDIVAITAAMLGPTGLDQFQAKFPDRTFDVGIAEQHAVTFAAGMACEGMKPVVAIYSTFLQRAYDQLIHDVAIQDLPILFALDRAGLVGADGATHAGSYDIAFLRCIPNMLIMTPSDEAECRDLLTTAYHQNHPSAVRYPRGAGIGATPSKELRTVPFGKAELRRRSSAVSGQRIAILAFGTLLYPALEVAEQLNASVANMRFVKPLDVELLKTLAQDHDYFVTIEDGVIQGGAGSACLEALAAMGINKPLLQLGLPDSFIEHGDYKLLMAGCGLNAEGILKSIQERFPVILPVNPAVIGK